MATFREITAAYVAERQALGFKVEKAEGAMRRICALHDEMGCRQDALPKGMVEAWCEIRPGEAESNRMLRVSWMRGLAEFMVRTGFDAYVPPRGRGRGGASPYEPHIFTNHELAALFSAADRIAGEDVACQRAQAALVLRLLYSTGMRCGEACSLEKGDVDLDAGVLHVRNAKNGRERVVPMHPSVAERMGALKGTAEHAHPQYASHARFWSLPEGRQLTRGYVYSFFRSALWEAGIPHGGRGKGPRVHDIRLAYACHRLRRWVEEGADVNSKMPVLAAYMGHADTRCTEYYLRLTAELYPGMVDQVERACGWVVPS